MLAISVEDLIAQTLQRLRQPVLNYDRFSKASILNALNMADLEVATRLKCIHGFGIIILKTGYAQYLPPSDMIVPKAAFYYSTNSIQSYYELKFKTRAWLDSNLPGWRLVTGPAWYMYPGDNLGNLRKLGVYPIPQTDGTNYLLAPDTGVVVSGTGLTTTGNITGVNTVANNTVCTDGQGRTLANLGVQIGMIAQDITDGSKGQISAVNGSTFTVALAGGTLNTWSVNDNWVILAGEYGVVTSFAPDQEQYIFSSDAGGMTNIQSLIGNIYLEYYRQPLPLVYDTQYPEIPQELHQFLPDYALWVLKRTSKKGSDDQQDATLGLQIFEAEMVKYESVESVMDTSTIAQNW